MRIFYIPDNIEKLSTDNPWKAIDAETIVMGRSIVTIDNGAFCGNKKIRSVILNNGIQRIGIGAFSGCTALETVKIGTHSPFLTVGPYAFKGCVNLTSVGLQIREIPRGCFYGCEKLNYEVSNRTISIDGEAFYGTACDKLIIDESDRLSSLGADAFSRSKLHTVSIKKNDIFVGEGAFSHCEDLKAAIVRSRYGRFGDMLFAGCPQLRQAVWIGPNRIPYATFSDCCSLRQMETGHIDYIEDYAFYRTKIKEESFKDVSSKRGEQIFVSPLKKSTY